MSALSWRFVNCLSACVCTPEAQTRNQIKGMTKFDYNKLLAITICAPHVCAISPPPSPSLAPQTVIPTVNAPSQQSQPWVAVGGTRAAAVRHAGVLWVIFSVGQTGPSLLELGLLLTRPTEPRPHICISISPYVRISSTDLSRTPSFFLYHVRSTQILPLKVFHVSSAQVNWSLADHCGGSEHRLTCVCLCVCVCICSTSVNQIKPAA